MKYKSIYDYEWSMGNGQCPCCYGNKPDKGWWTDTVGHKRDCVLAVTMEGAESIVTWEHKNPDREVGNYTPDGSPWICSIRHNDPDKKKKLAIGVKQNSKHLGGLREALSPLKAVSDLYDKTKG